MEMACRRLARDIFGSRVEAGNAARRHTAESSVQRAGFRAQDGRCAGRQTRPGRIAITREIPIISRCLRPSDGVWRGRACARPARVPIERREIVPLGRPPQGGPRLDFPPLWGAPRQERLRSRSTARADRPRRKDPIVTTMSSAEPTRRDFLYIATGAVGAIGAAATLVPLISQMNPV